MKSIQERIDRALNLRGVLQHYLAMETWTPVMGAMLLAGMRPDVGQTALPPYGGKACIGLDDSLIEAVVNTPFLEARKLLDAWIAHCEETGHSPSAVAPAEFIAWCVDEQIQERFARASAFVWIDAFKSAAGFPSRSDLIDFEVAAHAATSAKPLQTILDKIDGLERAVSQTYPRGISEKSRSLEETVKEVPAAPHRSYLTTEELAAALHVEPESIHKARSKNGHYCGVRPLKLPNRRLAWPLDAVKQITSER